MKKLLTLTLVVLLLAATVVPALAGGSKRTDTSGKQLYSLAGYIVGINEDDNTEVNTITVLVKVGNRIGKEYLEEEVTITTKSDTRLLLAGGTIITFDKFVVGDAVSSNGLLTFDASGAPIFTADRITKGASLTSKPNVVLP